MPYTSFLVSASYIYIVLKLNFRNLSIYLSIALINYSTLFETDSKE